MTRDTDLDGFTVRQGKGLGMDIGVLATPFERLTWGNPLAPPLEKEKSHYPRHRRGNR